MQNNKHNSENTAWINLSKQHMADSEAEKQNYIEQRMGQMERDGVPGVSIAVIHQDRIVWAQGYGVQDAETREPVTPNTLFQAASISKPVTAVAVLRLVEAGRLDLDEDIANYLTSWHVPKAGDWQPRITLRQLLCHGAGVTVHGFPGYARDTALPTLGQVLTGQKPANTEPIRVNALPGMQFSYSGGGYCILQQLLIDVTGQPFPELMRELVLEPVGMSQSTFEQPLPDILANNASSGHDAHGKPIAGKWHVYPEMAAAGLWTTPTDLARFALAMQRAGTGRFTAFLSPERVHQMFTPQVESFTGLGFRLDGQGASSRFSHTGGNEGFLCILEAYVDKDLGAVIMTNSDEGWQTIEEIKSAIAHEYAWPDYPPPTLWPTTNTALFDTQVGTYALQPGYTFTVLRKDDELWLQPIGQDALSLIQITETTYWLSGVEAEIVFEQGAQGEVTSLAFKHQGHTKVARKIVKA